MTSSEGDSINSVAYFPVIYLARFVYTVYIVNMTRVKALSSRHLAYKINENDHSPPHVHVEGLGASVRINLLNLEIMDSETDFSASTLKKIVEKVTENRILLLDKWEEVHGQ